MKRTVKEIIAGLPTYCATKDPVSGNFIIIEAGVCGYYPTSDIESQKQADMFNEIHGVKDEHLQAMITGSMFGWHVPGADPKEWAKK